MRRLLLLIVLLLLGFVVYNFIDPEGADALLEKINIFASDDDMMDNAQQDTGTIETQTGSDIAVDTGTVTETGMMEMGTGNDDSLFADIDVEEDHSTSGDVQTGTVMNGDIQTGATMTGTQDTGSVEANKTATQTNTSVRTQSSSQGLSSQDIADVKELLQDVVE